MGCFRRRSITFFTGQTDTSTEVWWLQSRGLTADLRVYPHRPALGGRGSIDDCTADELRALAANVEGGLARTWYSGEEMNWTDWTSFQTRPRWPEPGRLARVGDCLIEQAPSGAYIEDWRLQPTLPGPLIGLVLLQERRLSTGQVQHRGGGLVVCGQHACLVRGRPEGPLGPMSVFGCEVSYAERPSGQDGFVVRRSTHPWRERQPLPLDDFEYRQDGDLVIQRLSDDGQALERIFAIDTLETDVVFASATRPSPEAVAWLEREGDVLLATARRL